MSQATVDSLRAMLGSIPASKGSLRCETRDNVLEILIDNPTRAGAVSPEMMVQFAEIAAQLDPAMGTVILLHSSARNAFCAGGDLGSVRAHLLDPDLATGMVQVMTQSLNSIARSAAFVVAAVEGPALGGGAEILTACDAIVMGNQGRVGFVHAALGVSPGWGGAKRLIHRVGPRRALQWLVDPVQRTAEEAALMGMADMVVPSGTALDAARILAARVARTPATARAAAARLVKLQATDEAETFLGLWGGPDHRRALESLDIGR